MTTIFSRSPEHMQGAHLLIAAMTQKCRDMISRSGDKDCGLPKVLHPNRLLWMCDQIHRHVEEWPETRLHRWIGFVQCGMIANRILDLDGAKAMFDEVKKAWGASKEDQDLIDHLDPDNPFELDIGGEG